MRGRADNLFCRWRPRQRAFTLIEMMVSLGVLTLALGVVGVVFSVTTKTARQASAYSEALNWVRQFMIQLEEDLEHVDPSQSILVLAGRTQAAALTKEDLDGGKFYRVLLGNPEDELNYDPEYGSVARGPYSDPRADILMFFTNRAVPSAAPDPNAPNSVYARGAKLSPLQVVYGHAALGEPVWDGAAYQMPDPYDPAIRHIVKTEYFNSPTNRSLIPAAEWHLTRRATIIEPDPDPNPSNPLISHSLETMYRLVNGVALVDGSYNAAQWDSGDNGNRVPGDVALLDLPALFNTFGDAPFAPLDNNYLPAIWWPYGYSRSGASGAVLRDSDVDYVLSDLLYYQHSGSDQTFLKHIGTVLEEVPVQLRQNTSLHMLPGCVWFQIEFLMPEDPRNSFEYLPAPGALAGSRSDMPRWYPVEHGETYLFVPDTQENRNVIAGLYDGDDGQDRYLDFAALDPNMALTPDNKRIRMWPYAIRITVRVFDRNGTLDEPIVRTIVHRFE